MIYMMQAGVRGPFKVGMVKGGRAAVEARRAALQCGCPQELTVRAVAPGDADIEALMHTYLAAHRIGGEWFYIDPDEWDSADDPICDARLMTWIFDAMLQTVGYGIGPDPVAVLEEVE